MELRHLRYFVTVAEEQNITRAAARLNLSQPPLSRQIRDLEDELGVELLERSAKSVSLTAAGQVFLNEAQLVLKASQLAVAKVRAVSEGQTSQIRVAYAPTPTSSLLPLVLKSFRNLAPKAKLVLLDVTTAEMIEGLIANTIDIALLVRPPFPRDSNIEFHTLFEMHVGVIVARNHPFAKRSSVTPKEALSQPLVSYLYDGYADYHHWLARVAKDTKCRPTVATEVDGATSMVTAVESGLGFGFGPPTLATLGAGRVHFVSMDPPALPIEVGYARVTGRGGAIVDRFVESLNEGVIAMA